MNNLPNNYTERVYAGVLGKIIGVYLGRPFEGWSYDKIMEHLGEIDDYVHEKLDVPLIVTDDDISGTFTFLRALPDYGNSLELTPKQIGQTWLNYLIEERTILWWGGLGNSTEHTAYIRLKHGMDAPDSGSIATNGKVVAEQIGAQIFIDGWAMVAPGDPELAADLARRAGSVSHDGEAIYGAQVLAAMEAQAFVESDVNTLIDTAVGLIPSDSVIYRMIGDIREWHSQNSDDWRKTREQIAANYGYDKYGGNCHMVPNHGLIIHALLHGDDDFQKSLMIVNTCGWDTDCNSGNLGCLLGIKNGLEGINKAPHLREPVADRLYIPTADGGRAISDAVTEAYHIVNIVRAMRGERPSRPKGAAQFHFEMEGSVQGFMPDAETTSKGLVAVENVDRHSRVANRSLAFHYQDLGTEDSIRVSTPLFIPSKEIADYFSKRGYALHASPRLYAGQTVRAEIASGLDNTEPILVNLYLLIYGEDDELVVRRSEQVKLEIGDRHGFSWEVEDTGGDPIAAIGVEINNANVIDTGSQATSGWAYLDFLGWYGEPKLKLRRPEHNGQMWRTAWVNGMDSYLPYWPEAYRVIQNEGRGLLMQGTREWKNYQVRSTLTPHLVKAAGVAVRVQGMRRYYALLLCDDQKARLVKALDGDTVLAEVDFAWNLGEAYDLKLAVQDQTLAATIGDTELFTVEDSDQPLTSGGIALVCEEGRMATELVEVS